MCLEASAKLVYLSLYSLNLNPIEELFAKPKAFIRRHWQTYKETLDQAFDEFLERCIDVVAARFESA
jgi:hypothetical protein